MVIEKFSFDMNNKLIVGNVTVMPKACSVWINESCNDDMGSVIAAMPTKFDPMSISASIIDEGDEGALQCGDISKKLSTIFKMPVFVSSSGIQGMDEMYVITKLKDIIRPYVAAP